MLQQEGVEGPLEVQTQMKSFERISKSLKYASVFSHRFLPMGQCFAFSWNALSIWALNYFSCCFWLSRLEMHHCMFSRLCQSMDAHHHHPGITRHLEQTAIIQWNLCDVLDWQGQPRANGWSMTDSRTSLHHITMLSTFTNIFFTQGSLTFHWLSKCHVDPLVTHEALHSVLSQSAPTHPALK